MQSRVNANTTASVAATAAAAEVVYQKRQQNQQQRQIQVNKQYDHQGRSYRADARLVIWEEAEEKEELLIE